MKSMAHLSGAYEDQSTERLAWEQYLKEINRLPTLSREEEIRLAARIQEGDTTALDRLVEANLRFVVVVAMEYRSKGIPLLDLVNEGNIGLITAAHRFDTSRGCKFISYAVWWIRQAIRQAFADQVRFIRLPRLQVEALRGIEETIRRREQTVGGSVDARNTAVFESDMSAARYRHLVSLMNTAAPPISLDDPIEGGDSSRVMQVEDVGIAAPDVALMDTMLKEAVHAAIQDLPEREANILSQYYGMSDDDPKSLEEIGQDLGLSRERVRQLKERGLQRLRHTSRSTYLHAFL